VPRAITAALIDGAGARMGADGWRYTPRQLYYAVCAYAETPRSRSAARGELGLGLILLLIALILIRFPVPFVVLLTLGLLLVVLGGLQYLQPQSPLAGRTLALSFDAFLQRIEDAHPPGLIELRGDAGAPLDAAALRAYDTLVVCDQQETAAIVNANAARFGVIKIVAVAAADIDASPPHSAIVLHDAAPRGCALVLDLAERDVDVVDAGLQPEWVSSADHQVIEGAGARLPRDLSKLLGAEETDWLASGRRVEIATLTPAQVMKLVTAALSGGIERAAGVHVVELDEGQRAGATAPHPRG
jgi:hypothetical protein